MALALPTREMQVTGTTAYEWTGALPDAARAPAMHDHNTPSNDTGMRARKPSMGGVHMEH
jgi:hypothetical protein